jgi:predicted TIM-barrel fold metal-dependent hydrolase
MLSSLPVIDTMIGFPERDQRETGEFRPGQAGDPVEATVIQMYRNGVAAGLVSVRSEDGQRAVTRHPDRFVGCLPVDPCKGMESVREITVMRDQYAIKAVEVFPAGLLPQVAVNDKKMLYSVYAKCVELELPVFMRAGIPGPRVPSGPQADQLDKVLADFPELVVVIRHGFEPWTGRAVELMLKWPNLYYSTSAIAPEHYPEDIVRYANSRGAGKILYAGYHPAGLTLDRIMSELPNVPFKDEVWPRFLWENAVRILKIC